MSELTLLVIERSIIRGIQNSLDRVADMGKGVFSAMLELDKIPVSENLGIASQSLKVQESGIAIQPVSAASVKQAGESAKSIECARKLVGLVRGVKLSESLTPIRNAIRERIPDADALADNLSSLIQQRNSSKLDNRKEEIESRLEQISSVIVEEHNRLGVLEQESTLRVFEKSLSEIGFANQRRKAIGGGKQVIKASCTSTSIFAEIGINGTVRIDTMGFKGRECLNKTNQLIQQLSRNGIEVRRRDSILHGKAEGGELVKSAEPVFNPLDMEQERRRKQALHNSSQLRLRN